MKRAVKKLLIATLVMAMYFASLPDCKVYALTTKEKLQQAEQEHQETKSKLNETKQNIDSLNDTKDTLQDKLDGLTANLTEVSNNLADLENKIADKEDEIEEAEQDLAEAIDTENRQYESMKMRIKFMYEKKDYTYAQMIFTSSSFADFVNKNSYIEKLSEYDRKMLESYKETRQLVEEKKAKLEDDKKELDEYHEDVKEEQQKVAGYVDETSSTIGKYANEIKAAEAKADEYEVQAAKEEANISALKKKLAEEIAMSKLAAESSWRDISEVSFEEGDRTLLANLIYCEAGNQPYAGQLAVGAVVINRVLSSVYPGTVVGVIYQGSQFSPVSNGRLALALANDSATAACYKAADEAMSGQTNVGNCVYFRTPVEGLSGIQIGNHIFY
ncbi:MAG: cell wall hydrolase [Lachnospiraceae bacterium]|nr:cell wall hydrolase [Candidatus Colinaster equi]